MLLFCVKAISAQEVSSDLKRQLLAVKEWKTLNGDSISFNENGTLSFYEETEPVISGETKYKVEGNMLLFSFKNSSDPRLKGREFSCTLKYKEHDYLPKQYIACGKKTKKYDETKYYNPNSFNPQDYKYIIQDQKVVSTKRIMGIVNSDVYFREKPNIKSKPISFNKLSSEECMMDKLSEFKDESDITNQIQLPKGFSVEIIARTENMHKIDKLNNYWYFVSTSIGCYFGVTTTYGWIYGSFIDF